jgi:hypothetical protein
MPDPIEKEQPAPEKDPKKEDGVKRAKDTAQILVIVHKNKTDLVAGFTASQIQNLREHLDDYLEHDKDTNEAVMVRDAVDSQIDAHDKEIDKESDLQKKAQLGQTRDSLKALQASLMQKGVHDPAASGFQKAKERVVGFFKENPVKSIGALSTGLLTAVNPIFLIPAIGFLGAIGAGKFIPDDVKVTIREYVPKFLESAYDSFVGLKDGEAKMQKNIEKKKKEKEKKEKEKEDKDPVLKNAKAIKEAIDKRDDGDLLTNDGWPLKVDSLDITFGKDKIFVKRGTKTYEMALSIKINDKPFDLDVKQIQKKGSSLLFKNLPPNLATESKVVAAVLTAGTPTETMSKDIAEAVMKFAKGDDRFSKEVNIIGIGKVFTEISLKE